MAEKGNFLLLSPRLSFHRASAVDKRGGPGRQGELVESRLPVSALSSWKSDRADLNELETLSEVVEPSSLEKSQREMSSTVHLAALLLLLQGLGVLGIPPYELYGGYPSQDLIEGPSDVVDPGDLNLDPFLHGLNKRSCIRRGGRCDHRPDDCCSGGACRCNLWGTNCQCQRMGIFQKWG